MLQWCMLMLKVYVNAKTMASLHTLLILPCLRVDSKKCKNIIKHIEQFNQG